MKHEHAESAVKNLQRSFLFWIEEAEGLKHIKPNQFNDLRTNVFRDTFSAFRMGVIGIDPNVLEERDAAWNLFWNYDATRFSALGLDEDAHRNLTTRYIGVLLVCFRLGSAVALGGE